MPSELWKFNDWTRWLCEIGKRVWTAHTDQPYTYEVAHVGCHARWRTPENFRKGLVCEFGFGDEAYTILADLLPDEIYYPALNKIKARVTPELLTGQIELVYPMQNIVQGLPLPICGRFPLERALAENETGLTEEARRCLLNVLYLQECGDGGGGVVAWLEVVDVSWPRLGDRWWWVVVVDVLLLGVFWWWQVVRGCPQLLPKALGGTAEYAGMNSPPSTYESDEEPSEPSRAEAQTGAFWL